MLDGRREDRPEYWFDFVKRYGKNFQLHQTALHTSRLLQLTQAYIFLLPLLSQRYESFPEIYGKIVAFPLR